MNKTESPVVLVVEDDADYLMIYEGFWDGRVRMLGASSLDEAEALLPRLSDVAIVVMDGCVPGHVLNTVPLVRAIREREHFSGPVIACSSNADYRRMLLEAGCTHSCAKQEVPRLVLELLDS